MPSRGMQYSNSAKEYQDAWVDKQRNIILQEKVNEKGAEVFEGENTGKLLFYFKILNRV